MFGLQAVEWAGVVRDVGFPIALCGVFLWIVVKYLIPGVEKVLANHQAQNVKQGELFAETIKEHGAALKELNHDSNTRSAATVSAMNDLVVSIQPLSMVPPSLADVHRKLDAIHNKLPAARARARKAAIK